MKRILFVMLMLMSPVVFALDLDIGVGTCDSGLSEWCNGDQLMLRLGQDLLPLHGEDTIRIEVQRYGEGSDFFDNEDNVMNRIDIMFRIKLK